MRFTTNIDHLHEVSKMLREHNRIEAGMGLTFHEVHCLAATISLMIDEVFDDSLSSNSMVYCLVNHMHVIPSINHEIDKVFPEYNLERISPMRNLPSRMQVSSVRRTDGENVIGSYMNRVTLLFTYYQAIAGLACPIADFREVRHD